MSKRHKRTLKKIRENRENQRNGKPNCIPFTEFPRMAKVLPGIIKGTNWLISASSGVGKTQYTKSTFVFNRLEWLWQHQKDNPDSKIDIHINYFGLEESEEEFICSVISYYLNKVYDLFVDPLDLMSMYDKETVTDELMKKIESLDPILDKFFDKVDFIDSEANPYGIYKYVRQYSHNHGTHYWYNYIEDKEKENCITHEEHEKLKKAAKGKDDKSPEVKKYRQHAYSHYVPDNPDEYVINIVDHFSLLQGEKGEGLHAAMTTMSASYGRKQITKHYKHVFVNVQQQMGAQETDVYTNTGEKIIEKMKPTLAGLADNKTTQRDAHVVIGIFAPDRYLSDENKMYKGFDISKLKDQFRSAIVLKNRIGRGNIEVPLFFNGAITYFEELPALHNMTAKHYEKIKEIQKQINKV